MRQAGTGNDVHLIAYFSFCVSVTTQRINTLSERNFLWMDEFNVDCARQKKEVLSMLSWCDA